MVSHSSRRHLGSLTKVFAFSTMLLTVKCDSLQQPTRVPGSEHLILQTDFPYAYWRPSAKPYTPAAPSNPTSTPTSYGYYYGNSRNDYNVDASTWQMLPIQIPNDLVGAVNERTTRTTTPAAPYPTTVTPQYGRYPGVTEHPHLFHPERLYTPFKSQNRFRVQGSRTPNRSHYPNRQHSSQENTRVKDEDFEQVQISQPSQRPNWPKKTQAPWHQSLFNQLEPFVGTHLPKLPKLPSLPSINSITSFTNLPTWAVNILNKDEQDSKRPVDSENDKSGVEVTGDYSPHQFFPLVNPANKKHRKDKRPNQPFHNGQQSVVLSTPVTYDIPQAAEEQYLQPENENFGAFDYLPQSSYQDSSGNQNSFFDNLFQHGKKRIRPFNFWKRPMPNRRRPIRRNRIRNHSRFPPNNANSHLGDEFPSGQFSAIVYGDSSVTNQPLTNNNRPVRNRFRPNYQAPGRPFRQPRPKPNQNYGSEPPYPQDPPLKESQENSNNYYQPNPTGIGKPKPQPGFASDLDGVDYDSAIIDRLTDLNPLSSATVPGGMLVVAFALALFYFNFVWYPTPVVTARLIKLISDSVPDNLLDSEKQKAIGEVYEVFRGLEAEYMQDPDLWQPSCKTRLVCQVHQELPGLWQVTHTYESVVRSSLAKGPEGNEELDVFLEAAQDGNQGSSCNDIYKSCLMTPIPVRTSLQELFGIAHEESLPKVVYS